MAPESNEGRPARNKKMYPEKKKRARLEEKEVSSGWIQQSTVKERARGSLDHFGERL
jgi:hypothetical protein